MAGFIFPTAPALGWSLRPGGSAPTRISKGIMPSAWSVEVGKTGLRVPLLGLGCAALSGLYAPTPEEQALATVPSALQHGVNFFDTAPMYGLGLSEQRLGQALAGLPRQQFILATKVGKIITPQNTVTRDFSRAGVLRSLEDSLERLKLDHV